MTLPGLDAPPLWRPGSLNISLQQEKKLKPSVEGIINRIIGEYQTSGIFFAETVLIKLEFDASVLPV
jgi:hypothetical protein